MRADKNRKPVDIAIASRDGGGRDVASARERLTRLLSRPDKPQGGDYSPREVIAICKACAEVAGEAIVKWEPASKTFDEVDRQARRGAAEAIRSALADAEKEAERG